MDLRLSWESPLAGLLGPPTRTEDSWFRPSKQSARRGLAQFSWGAYRSPRVALAAELAARPWVWSMARTARRDVPHAPTCQWVMARCSYPTVALFCGAPSVAGRSYCACHLRIAYARVAP